MHICCTFMHMTNKMILDKKNRDFFRIVAKASFCNPFSTESLELNCKIAKGKFDSGEILIKKAVSNVRQRLGDISNKSELNWKIFEGEDRELIRIALLYDAYHKCVKEFDELIANQIGADHDLCTVPFANNILIFLRQSGFSAEEARLNFAFFFQLRRAWLTFVAQYFYL